MLLSSKNLNPEFCLKLSIVSNWLKYKNLDLSNIDVKDNNKISKLFQSLKWRLQKRFGKLRLMVLFLRERCQEV
jgi:hypothetical protein